MAYSATLPPKLLVGQLGGPGGNIWYYASVDDASAVRGANYITNAQALGMAVGDVVFHKDTDAGTITVGVSCVTAVTSSGATLGALT
jgi:hypothetical protein